MDKQPRIVSLTITPQNVDEHIGKCKSNRNLDRRHVQTYVRLIRQGLFRNGGLVFADTRGNYHDAQHRFRACKLTGHTAQFWVITGLNKEDLNMMVDSGKKRTNAARLQAAGVPYAALICNAIEDIMDIKERWKRNAAMLMADEVLGFLNDNPDLNQLAANWSSSDLKDVIQPRLLIAIQHLTSKIDADKSDQFVSDLTHRHLLKEGNPVHAFYQMLASEKVVDDDNHARVNRYKRNGLIQAWNAHLVGKTTPELIPVDRPITLDGLPATEDEPYQDEANGGAEEPESDETDLEAEGL